MKKIIYILPFFAATFLISCGNETETSEVSKGHEDVDTVAIVQVTKYSIDPSTVAVKWTAFKLAEKVGVNGEFGGFSVSGYQDNATTIAEMMMGAEITLEVASTKTGDEARDAKIIASFFGTMVNTTNISAKINSISGDESGIANVSITMNDMTVDQDLEWMYKADIKTFLLKGVLNVPDWGAQNALDALNKVCEEKHKGEGDKAITWPDVEVVASVLVNEITE